MVKRSAVVACVVALMVTLPRAQESVDKPARNVTTPQLIKEVKPEYTPEAKKAKIQGSVLLQATVTTTGTVADVAVARSLDQTFGLDQQAIKAAKEWRFKPGTRDGKPVPVRVTIELEFVLR